MTEKLKSLTTTTTANGKPKTATADFTSNNTLLTVVEMTEKKKPITEKNGRINLG